MDPFFYAYVAVAVAAISLLMILSIWVHVGRISQNSARQVDLLERLAKK